MSKEIPMTAKTPAAEVLRELMRDYVSQAREVTKPVAGLISAEERAERQAAVNFARANVGLEGFKSTPEADAHAQRFIDGEIDLKGYLRVQALRICMGD